MAPAPKAPTQASAAESLTRGRRTGVTVPAYQGKNGIIEDERTFFENRRVARESLDRSPQNTPQSEKLQKPKAKVRFSFIDENKDDSNRFQDSSPRVPRALHKAMNRESIDTNDLSSVSTADEDLLESRKAEEEEEEEEEVNVKVVHQRKFSPSSPPDDFPVNHDDDDLVPPEPPIADDNLSPEEEVESEVVGTTREGEEFPATEYDSAADDDNNEGRGFEMAEEENELDDEEDDEPDPKTPETTDSEKERRRRKEERNKKLAEKKKKKKKDQRHTKTSDVESDEDDEKNRKKKGGKKKFNRFATTFSPKGVPQSRTFKVVPVSESSAKSPDDPNLRRSRRARMKPLEFWRGERIEYGANDFGEEYDGVRNMPVPAHIIRPDPTPYKKRKPVATGDDKKKTKKTKTEKGIDKSSPEEIEPFDATKLKEKHKFMDGKTAHLWDEQTGEARGISKFDLCNFLGKEKLFVICLTHCFTFTEVVSHFSKMETRDLPISKLRKKSEGKVVGMAAQSFHMANDQNPVYPGYIVGSLILPPKGIKDAESVGLCAQVFTVVQCQPGAVEVAFNDPEQEANGWDPETAQRFLLSVGDNFLVPPGNAYRVENHSKSIKAVLSWTIIRHNRNVASP
jgi:centromere protein C